MVVLGTSLVVRWLRPHLQVQGMQVRSLVKQQQQQQQKKKKNQTLKRSKIETNLIKSLKKIHIKKNFK